VNPNIQANRKLSKKSKIYSPLVLLAVTAFFIPAPVQALVINATYDEGSLGSAAVAVINTAIAFYDSTFSNAITVNIDFHNMTSGLGSSLTPEYAVSYASYKQQLTLDATSANDKTALSSLPASVPSGGIAIKTATADALGYGIAGSTFTMASTGSFCTGTNLDGCVGLNLSQTTVGGGSYSLLATVEHEIDEVLGLGSSLEGNGTILGQPSFPAGLMSPEDLFRYSAPGVSSFALNNGISSSNCAGAPLAYFSINKGITNLDTFNNCKNGADYGDWSTSAAAQVQSAYGTPGATPSLTVSSAEVTALDVIGYTLTPQAKTLLAGQALLVKTQTGAQSVSEPTSVALFGAGLIGMIMARRRAQLKKNLRLDSRAAMSA